ncbi:hypothetical protein ACTQ49_06610 [Luteococcus sp. Sow4_B9]|uniref:hypothetical protein n=1 Tax=Luteococcus sp. Sow4_B9 TaxID=3438792 RepID=UPI003F9DFE10
MTMFLVGSGPSDTLDSVHAQFVESAKKRGTRVAIALLGTEDEAREQLASYAEPITSRWPEAQIEPVWLDDEPDQALNTTVWPAEPEGLAALVVAGGWTPGYLDALRPRRELIATLVRRGVPYLGYSAGAAVVGKRSLVGGWKFRGRQVAPEIWGEGLEELELRDGLALIGPSVDVHGDVAGLGAGLAALEKGDVTTVVSIDEGTCLVVDPVSGRTRVEGTQRVHWLTREGSVSVVRHESSAAELERHQGYLQAEKEAAEREEEARRAAAEKAAAEKAEAERLAAEERARRQAEQAALRAEQQRQERERLEAEEKEREAREAERARIAAEKAEEEARARAAEEAEAEARRQAEEAESQPEDETQPAPESQPGEPELPAEGPGEPPVIMHTMPVLDDAGTAPIQEAEPVIVPEQESEAAPQDEDLPTIEADEDPVGEPEPGEAGPDEAGPDEPTEGETPADDPDAEDEQP